MKRRTKPRETIDIIAMTGRMLDACGRRCANADEPELIALVGLRADLDDAIDVAVAGLRARGLSWAKIGGALGMSRQAAQQRWSEVAA